MVLALIALVIGVDQAIKWWAWRHVPWTRINSGGDVLVGHAIGALYSGRVTGALLDLLDFGVLSIAVSVLARCRVPATVGVSGALMTGGWSSNLLDRLGTHYWTAPDSVRGAIDFIHIGAYYYNLADFFIIGCTPLFLLAAGYEGVRTARRLAAAGNLRPLARGRLWSWVRIPALAGAGLTLVVALGAANYGGVNAAPPRPPAHPTTHPHVQLVRQVLVAGIGAGTDKAVGQAVVDVVEEQLAAGGHRGGMLAATARRHGSQLRSREEPGESGLVFAHTR
jgi:lipoprotein signal peptidase